MILYKYRSLSLSLNQRGESAKSLSSMILKNTSLWFARPESLNDPLDCQISIKELSSRILENKPQNPFIPYPKSNFVSPYTTDYLDVCEDIDRQHSNHGVLSMCTSKENLVMWSHYADEYRGLCFGFDLDLLKESVKQSNLKLYWCGLVNYCEETPLIEFFQKSLSTTIFGIKHERTTQTELFMSKMGSKHKQWSHEQEYRFLTDKFGSCVFNPQALREVILGHAIFEEDKTEIVKFIKDKLPHVKIYESFFNSTFKLHFKIYVAPSKGLKF